jgi:dolichol-phosphate mannosyltransferase
MTRRSLSIIVPAFNEAGNIMAALEGVLWAAERARLDEYEVILVDDGSVDATLMTARHTVRSPFLRTVRHPSNLGLRAAYETGLGLAAHTYVTWAPGDGEIARESLLAIFEKVGEADLVVPYHGTPEMRPWFRRALTWISTTEMNLLLGQRINYYQGPVLYPVALARCLPRTIDGFFSMAEMLACALSMGFGYVEVPLEHRERTYGVSKAVSWRRIRDAEIAVLGFFWRFRVRGEARRRLRLDFASP